MNKLEEARLKINEVDQQMAKLFEERMSAVQQVIEYKIENHQDILDSSRENEVIERNLEKIQNKELKKYYKKYIIMQMQISKEYQADFIKKTSE